MDFDGITGLNNVRIDLSGDAFFATLADYTVVITAGEVGGVSVIGEVVATFSIENRSMGQPAGATLAADLAAVKTVVDGIPTTMRGTDDAALASVVGALDDGAAVGDPTVNDTLVQYIKQLINVLIGTAGVGTMPAAADPADGVNLFEVLRRVFDDTDELQNDDVPGLIGALSDPDAETIADAVWDEILTGATHNIATSAGRRLRGIQDFQGYEDGAVWVDTVNGSNGTTDFENGTVENPVKTMAEANTLAASLGLERFRIDPGSTIVLPAAQNNQVFTGENWTLDLNGKDIAGSYFAGAAVSGIAAGAGTTQIFKECIMGATSHIKGTHLLQCGFSDTQTIVEAGDFFADRCHSGMAGTSTPVWDFGALLAASNLSFRNYSGGIEIENMGTGAGSYNMSLEGRGQLIINANCSATSTVAIRGAFTVTDNAGGTVTLSDDARYDTDQINEQADLALTDIHLDHLLAVDYDPASKPGVATALLNELIENNGGVSRYTAAALTQAWAVVTRILTANTNFNDLSAADVNAEVVDVINTDASGEPAQGAPPATASLREKIDWLFKSWRNKKDNDGATTQLYADDGATVDSKQTTSEAGGTVTKGEWVSGP